MASRARTLASAAALAALFAGLVTWARLGVERPDAAARAAHERTTRPLPFSPADATAVAFARKGEPPVIVERDGAGWRITAPSPGPASSAAVEALLDRLAALRVRATLPPEPASLAARGLDPPGARVAVTLRDGQVLRLDLGVESPFDQATFARADGRVDGKILVVEGVPQIALDPEVEPLRVAPGGG